MKFYFCEKCGKRVTEMDIEGGSAKNKKLKGIYCTACSAGVMTMETLPMNDEEAKQLLRTHSPRTESRASRTRMKAPSARRMGESQKAGPSRPEAISGPSFLERHKILPIAGGVGAVLLVAGIFLLAGNGSPRSEGPQKGSGKSSSLKSKKRSGNRQGSPEEVVGVAKQTSVPQAPQDKSNAASNSIEKATAATQTQEEKIKTQSAPTNDEMDFLGQRIKRQWSAALKQANAVGAGGKPIEKLKAYHVLQDTLRSFPRSRVTPAMEEIQKIRKTAAEEAVTALLKSDTTPDAKLSARIRELEETRKLAGGLKGQKDIADCLKELEARRQELQRAELEKLLKGKKLLPGLVADLHRGDVGSREKLRTFKPHHRQIVTKIENPRKKGRPYFKSGTSNKLSGRFTGFFMDRDPGKNNCYLLV